MARDVGTPPACFNSYPRCAGVFPNMERSAMLGNCDLGQDRKKLLRLAKKELCVAYRLTWQAHVAI